MGSKSKDYSDLSHSKKQKQTNKKDLLNLKLNPDLHYYFKDENQQDPNSNLAGQPEKMYLLVGIEVDAQKFEKFIQFLPK